ncbi:MAG: EpsG family protein [Culicoidibacterales bacterium]
MIFYTIILITVVLLAIQAQKYQKNERANVLFTVLIIVVLTLVSGLRYRVGTDFGTYSQIYGITATKTFIEVISGSEPLFNLIVWLSSQAIYEPQIMFFVMALLTVSFIVLGIRKYTNNFPFSIFLYLATFSYFTAMNGMRQWLAVAIVFYFFDLMLEKKLLKFIIVIFVASLIHTSAIFILPIYFVIHKKHTTQFVMATFACGALLFVMYPFIDSVLAQFLGDYGHYLTSSAGYGAAGVKGIRVVVPLVIYGVSYFYLHKNIQHPKVNAILNLILIGSLIATLGIYSKAFFRIISYFSIYEVLIIPLFYACVGRREKVTMLAFLVLSFYLYVNVLWRVDSNVLPYQTVFERK